MRTRGLGAVLAGVLVAATAMAAAPPVGKPAPPPVGKPAPGFSLGTTDGRTVKLAELRGKPVVLNFWHSG